MPELQCPYLMRELTVRLSRNPLAQLSPTRGASGRISVQRPSSPAVHTAQGPLVHSESDDRFWNGGLQVVQGLGKSSSLSHEYRWHRPRACILQSLAGKDLHSTLRSLPSPDDDLAKAAGARSRFRCLSLGAKTSSTRPWIFSLVQGPR